MTARLPSPPKGRPFVLGHRGARAHAPDNTMRAFELALDHGADGIEIDVRMTGDGALRIAHDEEIEFAGVDRPLSLGSLSTSQLEQLKLPSGDKLVGLRDVLRLQARSGCLVNVELKGAVSNPMWMCEQTAAELRAHGGHGIVLSSFSPLIVRRLAQLLPEIPVALLFDQNQSWTKRALPLGIMGASGAHPEDACTTASLVRRIKKKHGFVGVWTVNDPARARELADWGVDVIISDDPKTIVAALSGS